MGCRAIRTMIQGHNQTSTRLRGWLLGMVDINDYIGRLPSQELAAETMHRIDTWNDSLTRNGLIAKMNRNYRLYYNADPYAISSGQWNDFGVTGDNGEYREIRINHFRSLITSMINMIFAKFPALKSRAA